MSEERFVELESRMLHQDKLLQDLNDVVTEQQVTIMRLNELCRTLIDRVRAMNDAVPSSDAGDERPPHY